MTVKRSSLSALAPKKAAPAVAPSATLGAPDAPAEPAAAPADASPGTAPARGKAPAPYKSVLSKIDEAAHKQLKRLAIDEGVPVGDLQVQALNLLFRSRGLPEIAVRVTPDESGRRG